MESTKNINHNGQLTASQLEQLEVLEGAQELRLSGGEEVFPHPNILKRSSIEGFEGTLWDELCIASAEGDPQEDISLSPEKDAALLDQSAHLRGLKLQADRSIIFEGKQSLKHKTPLRSLRPVIWSSVAAAAVALAVVFPILKEDKPDNAGITQPIAATVEKSAVTTPATRERVETKPVMENRQPSADTGAAQKRNATGQKEQRATEQVKTEPTPKIQNQEMPVFAPVTTQDQELLAMESKPSNISIDEQPVQDDFDPEQFLLAQADKEKNSKLRDIAEKATLKEHPGRGLLSSARSSLDFISEKSIVALNSLLARETVVMKTFDSEGNIVSRNVSSQTITLSRNYEQQE